MSKELVEEIMAAEKKAEEELERAQRDKESMVRKAKEKAMHITQEAEHSLDTERTNMIAAHDKTLHAQKEQTMSAAQNEAKELRRTVEKKIDPASTYVLNQFTEYVRNDLS